MDYNRLDGILREMTVRSDTSGMSVGIVSGGRLDWYNSYGYRDVDRKLEANKDTIYSVGSTSKAMTAACLATFRDEGKLDWNRPVIDYLPELRMYDEYAWLNVTLKDMLCHRTGVPRHDLSWYMKGEAFHPTAALVQKLQWCEPNAEFRTVHQYNNIMFSAASLVLERISGMSFEEAMQERLFRPLGMTRTSAASAIDSGDNNWAVPYARYADGGFGRTVFYLNGGIAGAGAVNSTTADMARWLAFCLTGKNEAGEQILSQKTLEEIHMPVAVNHVGTYMQDAITLSSYGFGWYIHNYRGHKCLVHGGNIDGYSTFTAFLPDKQFAVVIIANMTVEFLSNAAVYTILDQYLDAPDTDWKDRYDSALAVNREKCEKDAEELFTNAVPLDKDADTVEMRGEYKNPAYGTGKVYLEDDVLYLALNGFDYELRHITGDTFAFSMATDYPWDQFTVLRFTRDDLGRITSLDAALEPLLDKKIRFDKLTGCEV